MEQIETINGELKVDKQYKKIFTLILIRNKNVVNAMVLVKCGKKILIMMDSNKEELIVINAIDINNITHYYFSLKFIPKNV